MKLRPYQQAAKEAVFHHLRQRDDNPCVVIPTGGGKTPIIASVCRDVVRSQNYRVLIIAHVKELLEQVAEKLELFAPDLKFGIYAANLNRRQTKESVIIASIQSIYKRARELGAFDLILVDEAHLIPPEREGTYHQFLRETKSINPNVRVVGFTATPFRTSSGSVCAPKNVLNHVCFEIGVKELIREGYLSPLVPKAGQCQADVSGLDVRGGEFVATEMEALMDQAELVAAACQEMVELTRQRNAVLIFASGIDHARHVQNVVQEHHRQECGFVCGGTPAKERNQLLDRFRKGSLKYCVNVNVLTTGFDASRIDCVVLLRPTLSPGLYYQMVGRGFRLHGEKENCLILDFGGNVLRHGPVDRLTLKKSLKGEPGDPPVKECPECHVLVEAGAATCSHCQHCFPLPERSQHEPTATSAAILSPSVSRTSEHVVRQVTYSASPQPDAGEMAPRVLRVDYRLGVHQWVSELIDFEHPGQARRNAEQWWQQRSKDPVPDSTEWAEELANVGSLAQTLKITVRHDATGQFAKVVDHELGPIPDPLPLDELRCAK